MSDKVNAALHVCNRKSQGITMQETKFYLWLSLAMTV